MTDAQTDIMPTKGWISDVAGYPACFLRAADRIGGPAFAGAGQ